MTRLLLAAALAAIGLTSSAADPAKIDHAAVGRLLKEAGYKMEDSGIGYGIPVGDKPGWEVGVMLDPIDASVVFVQFFGGNLPAKGYDPEMLVKLLRANFSQSGPSFGISKNGTVALTLVVPSRDVTADRLKQAVSTVSTVAAKTTALWDTALWPAPKK